MSHSVLSLQLPKSHLQNCYVVVITLKSLNFGVGPFLAFNFVAIILKTLDFATGFFLGFDFVVILLKTLDFATGFFLGFDFVVIILKPLTVFACKQATCTPFCP